MTAGKCFYHDYRWIEHSALASTAEHLRYTLLEWRARFGDTMLEISVPGKILFATGPCWIPYDCLPYNSSDRMYVKCHTALILPMRFYVCPWKKGLLVLIKGTRSLTRTERTGTASYLVLLQAVPGTTVPITAVLCCSLQEADPDSRIRMAWDPPGKTRR